jgi:hypothetical protein
MKTAGHELAVFFASYRVGAVVATPDAMWGQTMKITVSVIVFLLLSHSALVEAKTNFNRLAENSELHSGQQFQSGPRGIATLLGSNEELTYYCTGFFADLGRHGEKSQVRFLTAQHCNLPNTWNAYVDANVPLGSNDIFTDSEEGYSNPYALKFSFKSSELVAQDPDIAVYSKTPKHLPRGVHVLRPAERPPTKGARLTLVGYPGGFGPYQLRCSYLGVSIKSSPVAVRSEAIAAMKCDTSVDGTATQGFSGGPVQNESGELVGILSGSINDSNEVMKDHRLIMLFHQLTSENLTGDADHPVRRLAPGLHHLDSIVSQTKVGTTMRNGALQPVAEISYDTNASFCVNREGQIEGSVVERSATTAFLQSPTGVLGSEKFTPWILAPKYDHHALKCMTRPHEDM